MTQNEYPKTEEQTSLKEDDTVCWQREITYLESESNTYTSGL